MLTNSIILNTGVTNAKIKTIAFSILCDQFLNYKSGIQFLNQIEVVATFHLLLGLSAH